MSEKLESKTPSDAAACSAENLQLHWNDISVELALRKLEKVSTATLYALGQRDASDLIQQARYELRKYNVQVVAPPTLDSDLPKDVPGGCPPTSC